MGHLYHGDVKLSSGVEIEHRVSLVLHIIDMAAKLSDGDVSKG